MDESAPLKLSTSEVSVYHNLREPLWKNSFAHSFSRIERVLQEASLIQDGDIAKLRHTFITNFNSNHSQDTFCRRTQVILRNLKTRLNTLARQDLWELVEQDVESTTKTTAELLTDFDKTGGVFFTPEQSLITDGGIHIAGEPLEIFAAREYFDALGRLFNYDGNSFEFIREAFFKGANLRDEDVQLVKTLRSQGWDTVDTLSSLLISQQTTHKFPSVQDYEFNPDSTQEENQRKKEEAIKEAAFCVGVIVSAASYLYGDSDFTAGPTNNPISLFLQGTNGKYSIRELEALKKIALAHVTHGLNSGELTARLAGSVRTTLPRAIIASLNVRSGSVHAGAVIECMNQISDYLQADISAREYVHNALSSGEKLYGFGHRIHKTETNEPPSVLGKDPRVDFYIRATLEGFPEKADVISRITEYARVIREIRPSLGANTDFGASVLFTCLGLNPQGASAFFTAFRLPGICANVVNELRVKANARRPPFPPVIPF